MRHENYAFGTRPAEPETPKDSLLRKFVVRCLKCGSYKLTVVSEHDSEAGETKVYLVCPRCRDREALPVR